MGIVVTAEHLLLRKQVAIKFLLPSAMELPGAAARFMREAQSSATIQSEHVARVLDVGQRDDGTPFMVMEFLSGSDLSAILHERGPLPLQEAIDLVLQACEALAEAHAAGIIHRDLKPGNLFVTKHADGSPLVKVLDFGLSKVRQVDRGNLPEGSITESEAVLGSPQYMSPEQFRSFKNVDARTDVWALGVILYLALTGKRPFDGDSFASLCMNIVSDEPEPLRTIKTEIPIEVDTAVMQCLVKDTARRTQTVTELARALAPFGSSSATISFERIAKILPMGATVPLPRLSSAEAPSGHAEAPKREIETASSFARSGTFAAKRTRSLALGFGVVGAICIGSAFGFVIIGRQHAASQLPASSAVETKETAPPRIMIATPSAIAAVESAAPSISSSSVTASPSANASAPRGSRVMQASTPGQTPPGSASASSTAKTKYDVGDLSF